MRTCAECMLCLLNRDIAAVPDTVPTGEKAEYLRDLMRLLADADPSYCTAQLGVLIDNAFAARFGERKTKNFAELKRIYNEKLLALEPLLREAISHSPDPLAYAIRLARVGNYIDFGAKHEVDDALFRTLLTNVQAETLDAGEYERFRADLSVAETGLYLTDNAGEIVLDKLLLMVLKEQYPNLVFTVMVRGAPTLNDATAEDAEHTGLSALFPVVGNGNGLPGTIWSEISDQARNLLTGADVVISKGQANFESLSGCELNVYYLLLCKCDYFVRRFAVPRLTGLFVNERRLPFAVRVDNANEPRYAVNAKIETLPRR